MNEFVGQHPENLERIPQAQRRAISTLVEACAKMPWVGKVVAASVDDSSWHLNGEQRSFGVIIGGVSREHFSIDEIGSAVEEAGLLMGGADEELRGLSRRSIFLTPDKFEMEMEFLQQEGREVVPLFERQSSQQ